MSRTLPVHRRRVEEAAGYWAQGLPLCPVLLGLVLVRVQVQGQVVVVAAELRLCELWAARQLGEPPGLRHGEFVRGAACRVSLSV